MNKVRGMLGIILCLALVACSPAASQKPVVATTFFPLQDFTQAIVGDQATVFSLVPAGVEPHEYEPTPRDSERLQSSVAYVMLGKNFGGFEDKLVGSAGTNTVIIDASAGIKRLPSSNKSAVLDPHVWLSPARALQLVQNIAAGLQKIPSLRAEVIIANTQILSDQLRDLDRTFQTELSNCSKHVILVDHDAFSYLARDYGFETVTLAGLEPEAEPSPQQLKHLIDVGKAQKLKFVFYESTGDSRIARAIAQELGAQVLPISTAESSEKPGDTYMTLMNQNLEHLAQAMECS